MFPVRERGISLYIVGTNAKYGAMLACSFSDGWWDKSIEEISNFTDARDNNTASIETTLDFSSNEFPCYYHIENYIPTHTSARLENKNIVMFYYTENDHNDVVNMRTLFIRMKPFLQNKTVFIVGLRSHGHEATNHFANMKEFAQENQVSCEMSFPISMIRQLRDNICNTMERVFSTKFPAICHQNLDAHKSVLGKYGESLNTPTSSASYSSQNSSLTSLGSSNVGDESSPSQGSQPQVT